VHGFPSSQPGAAHVPPQQIWSDEHVGSRTHVAPSQRAVSHGAAVHVVVSQVGYWQPSAGSQRPPAAAVQSLSSGTFMHPLASHASTVQATRSSQEPPHGSVPASVRLPASTPPAVGTHPRLMSHSCPDGQSESSVVALHRPSTQRPMAQEADGSGHSLEIVQACAGSLLAQPPTGRAVSAASAMTVDDQRRHLLMVRLFSPRPCTVQYLEGLAATRCGRGTYVRRQRARDISARTMRESSEQPGSAPTDAARIARRIRDYLETALPGLEREIETLDARTPLHDVIGSFSLIELAEFVEQAFGIEVAPLDFVPENFRTIERIAAYVVRRHGVP
jgi:acyl carrier protein